VTEAVVVPFALPSGVGDRFELTARCARRAPFVEADVDHRRAHRECRCQIEFDADLWNGVAVSVKRPEASSYPRRNDDLRKVVGPRRGVAKVDTLQ
jgi:hypothetical protein